MEDVKIDEDALSQIAKQALNLATGIADQSVILTDKNEDVFIRYLAFNRLTAVMAAVNAGLVIFTATLRSGHNINHEVLQTEQAKEKGWNLYGLERDPFFCSDDQHDKAMSPGVGDVVGKRKKQNNTEH